MGLFKEVLNVLVFDVEVGVEANPDGGVGGEVLLCYAV